MNLFVSQLYDFDQIENCKNSVKPKTFNKIFSIVDS